MKIFDQVDPWPEKVNFVDQNNVILGYDMFQNCCEHAYWDITDKPFGDEVTPSEELLESYVFDTNFIQYDDEKTNEYGYNKYENGGAVSFRITCPTSMSPDLYINLYNHHNGYYSHGFEFGVKDGDTIESGCL